MPSPVTAGGFDVEAKICPKPPEASTTARAVTMPIEDDEPRFVEHGDAHSGRLPVAVGARSEDEVEGEPAAQHLDARTDRRLVEGPLHLGAGLVAAGMDDPVVAVSALAGEGDRPVVVAVTCCCRGRTRRRAASGSGSTSVLR